MLLILKSNSLYKKQEKRKPIIGIKKIFGMLYKIIYVKEVKKLINKLFLMAFHNIYISIYLSS